MVATNFAENSKRNDEVLNPQTMNDEFVVVAKMWSGIRTPFDYDYEHC